MSTPDIKWIDFRRHASVVSHSGDHKIYEASNEPMKGCPAYIEKFAYDALQSRVQELSKALSWYADINNWHYTSYDNYHRMADDAGTVKFPNGDDADISGARARAALTEGDGK
jgi:hypothetical protein